MVVAAAASGCQLTFVTGSRLWSSLQPLPRAAPQRPTSRGVLPSSFADLGSDTGFTGDSNALGISLFLFLGSLPGILSTINREGQVKFIEKTYCMPGKNAGGLEMRSIAGGVAAYFKTQNYTMKDSPTKGKVRFEGTLQGSVSQAFYLTFVTLGALSAIGLALSAAIPEGIFGLGNNIWFAPCIISPYSGWYYWSRAFRKDVLELQLEDNEAATEMTLSILGDKTAIEEMQKGVRFQSQTGKLFQLQEKDMEYQPGIWDEGENAGMVWTDKTTGLEVKAEPMNAKVSA